MKIRIVLLSSLIVILTMLVFILIYQYAFNNNVEKNPDNYLKTKGTFSMDLEVFTNHINKIDTIKYRYHPQLGFLVDDNQYIFLKLRYNNKKFLSEKKG